MEKLILKSGRFFPPTEGDPAARIRYLEAYLSALTTELEYLTGEMDRVLAALESAVILRDGLVTVASSDTGKEGFHEATV